MKGRAIGPEEKLRINDEFLMLKFDVPFPLSLIFTQKSIVCYQLMFRYVFLCRYAEMELEEGMMVDLYDEEADEEIEAVVAEVNDDVIVVDQVDGASTFASAWASCSYAAIASTANSSNCAGSSFSERRP